MRGAGGNAAADDAEFDAYAVHDPDAEAPQRAIYRSVHALSLDGEEGATRWRNWLSCNITVSVGEVVRAVGRAVARVS